MENKLFYEEVKLEIVPLAKSDVVTSSSAFDGDDDKIVEWVW